MSALFSELGRRGEAGLRQQGWISHRTWSFWAPWSLISIGSWFYNQESEEYLVWRYCFRNCSVQFSRSLMSDSSWPHGPQHARPSYPSPTPWVYSNSSPLSQWCHPTLSFSAVPFSSLPSIFPNIRVFSNESALCIRWPKYWSFSFNVSPSNEHSGLISFRMDWLNVQSFCLS